ncbi:MAG: hypothetical protein KI790_00810 [Cyclobacteriaceae bacterium]|nr:hypothetical protein [Cyclobacteriaceae bacterium HetDA_MAG_MS6]
MKNIYLIILSLAVVAFSCEDFSYEDDQGFDLEELPAYVAWDSPGESVTENNVEAEESDDDITFTVEAPTGMLSDVTVTYAISGTATLGTDYTISGASGAQGTVVIPYTTIGQANDPFAANIVVELLTDAVDEGEETIILTLVSAVGADGTNYAIGRGGTEILTIATVALDDSDLTLSLSANALTIDEDDADTAKVTMSLSYATTQAVTFSITSLGGSLGIGTDFTFTSGTGPFTIPAGETEIDLEILPINDSALEDMLDSMDVAQPFDSVTFSANDSLTVALSAVSIGGGLDLTAADTLKFFIKDDIKTVSTDNADSTALSSANDIGFLNFPVTLSSESLEDVTVNYTITTTNAAAGVDYTDLTGGAVTLTAGQTSGEITIQVLSAALDAGTTAGNGSIEIEITSITSTDAEAFLDEDNSDNFILGFVRS